MKFEMKSFLFTVAMCAVVVLGAEAQAATFRWIGGAGDFLDPTKWDVGTVPVLGDRAEIEVAGADVTLNAPAGDVARLAVEDDAVMTIGPSGSLKSTGWSFLGRNGAAGTTGTLNINGGSMESLEGAFIVGREGGILNMTGGLLKSFVKFHIGDKPGQGGGVVQLDGGMIVSGNFLMGPGPALMDITAGVMKITPDPAVFDDPAGTPSDPPNPFPNIGLYVDAQVAANILTGYGGAGVVMHSFDASSGTTTIWAEAIPEPTSIVLLGLAGSLLAIGRRR